MDIPNPPKENEETLKPQPDLTPPKEVPLIKAPVNINTLMQFFNVAGASTLYCLSAVCIAYGIVKVLTPVLEQSETLREAIPCLLTLHGYELALLGALLLIVSKKVVNDAVSLTILMSLFLIGTAIALGSVADRAISASYGLSAVGIALGSGKLFCMRRFARIPFGLLSFIGLTALVACNYLGPVLLAGSIASNPSEESVRRGLWLLICAMMLTAGIVVLIEASRKKLLDHTQQNPTTPFLQSPAMVYVFTLIIIIASGIHQYTMAYAFALERVMIDYIPIIAVGCLLLTEILRHLNKRNMMSDVGITCIPLALTMLAIYNKSVLASGQFGLGLLCYPPTLLAIIGLAIAAIAYYHRLKYLWIVVYFYVMGIILTAGFSPEYPHVLNVRTVGGILVASLLIYGLIIRNPYVGLFGIAILCLGLAQSETFTALVKQHNITPVSGLAGVAGISMLALYLIFTNRLHKAVQILSGLCLATLLYDYLPSVVHWKYLWVIVVTGVLIAILWVRTRNLLVITILISPLLIRTYMLLRQIAYWRFIILGFILLVVGTCVSLFKHQSEEIIDLESEQ